jgi:hypothetical protein
MLKLLGEMLCDTQRVHARCGLGERNLLTNSRSLIYSSGERQPHPFPIFSNAIRGGGGGYVDGWYVAGLMGCVGVGAECGPDTNQ